MRIHIASHLFTPRPQGVFCAELAAHWAAQGHEVVVFTADGGPGEPPLEGQARYRVVGGLPRQYGRSSLWDRLTSRLRFARSAWTASRAEAREHGAPDLYLAAGALPALAAAFQRGTRLGRFMARASGKTMLPQPRIVVWLFDLWPDVLVAHRPESRAVQWAVPLLSSALAQLLARVDTVVTISSAMAKVMRERIPSADVRAVPLWAPNEAQAPALPATTPERDPGPLRAVYHGNLGLSYDFAHILECAGRFKPTEVQFLLVGDGARKNELETHIAREGLANVRVRPPVPLARLWESLADADVYLLPLQDTWDVVSFPSKLLAYLACGRPIVVSGAPDGESARLVRLAHCGLSVPATADGLERALQQMLRDREVRAGFARAGRQLYDEQFAARRAFESWDLLVASSGERSPPGRLTC